MIKELLSKSNNPREVLKVFNTLPVGKRKELVKSCGLSLRQADIRQLVNEGARWHDETINYSKYRKLIVTNSPKEDFNNLFN